VQAAAPLRVHPVWHRAPGVHRAEVLRAAAEARRHPPLPSIRVQALAPDGVPPSVPVFHRGQLQAWCQASSHRQEDLGQALADAQLS